MKARAREDRCVASQAVSGSRFGRSPRVPLSSQHDAHVRAARNSDRSPRSGRSGRVASLTGRQVACMYDVASRKGAGERIAVLLA